MPNQIDWQQIEAKRLQAQSLREVAEGLGKNNKKRRAKILETAEAIDAEVAAALAGRCHGCGVWLQIWDVADRLCNECFGDLPIDH